MMSAGSQVLSEVVQLRRTVLGKRRRKMPSSTVALRSSPLGPNSLSKQLGMQEFNMMSNCIFFDHSDAFCFSPLSLPSEVRLLRFHGANMSVCLSFPAA